MANESRLPPSQQAIGHLPVRSTSAVPAFDPASWDLRIEGEVITARRLTYPEVRGLPSIIDVSDFHCVETWSVLDCAWEGVRFSDLCDLVSPTERAHHVTIGCDGGYTTSLTIQEALEPDVLLAWGLNGRELDLAHGFPLRLVVPKKYAYKAAKWVRRIEFAEERELGYWEARGYNDNADPWREERYR
jgi:DMSO/TMAO reductase YedYZ molybdopterin-dependent catalytic subunit